MGATNNLGDGHSMQTIPKLDLADPSAGLLRQFLGWVAARPRTYDEAMDAWRTSCPRISVWEDALAEDLVEVRNDGVAGQGQARVLLTPAGAAQLDGWP